MGADGETRRSGGPPKGPLTRVPPHDLQTERNLLGSALLSQEAAEVVAGMDRYDFYNESHQLIAGAFSSLVAEGRPVDIGMVSAELRAQGQLDAVKGEGCQGNGYLIHLQAGAPSTGRDGKAAQYADYIVDYSHKRRLLSRAGDIVDAIYSNVPVDGLIADMAQVSAAAVIGRTSSWDVANLALTLAGEGTVAEPMYLHRNDGAPLLYPGKVHAFNAEPETGKSWLSLAVCAERLAAGEHALYIDFEAGPADIVERLLALGVTPAVILDQFHYVRPDEPVDAAARLRVLGMMRAWPITVCIIDGMAEALALSGWAENDATDVTSFFAILARPIAREGAAVVIVDHLQKDKEKQGAYARGSGAKLAAIDGATFKLEVVKPFARGQSGVAKVVVTKDRHGYVRRCAAGGRIVGEMHLSSTSEGETVTFALVPPASDDAGHFRPTFLMERISRLLEDSTVGVSQRWVERNVKGTATHIRTALGVLVAEGYVKAEEVGGRTTSHSSIRPFREPAPEPEDPGYDQHEEYQDEF